MSLPKVFFYCCDEIGNLQEDIIAIAEGLHSLGIPYYASCDYWLQSTTPGDYLFRRDPRVNHQDCDIVIVTYTWPRWVRMGDFRAREQPLPKGLFVPGRTWSTVFMDNNDGYRTISWEPEYRQFDAILRTKYNSRAFHPSNMRPWAYGLTRRVIKATEGSLPFAERSRTVLVNFGASHPFAYGARDLSARRFEPKIVKALPVDRAKDDLSKEPADPLELLMWRQTGGRFSRCYYERLKRTQAVACFCGDIIPPAPWRPERYLVGGTRARLKRLAFELLSKFDRRSPRAVGADSFRFWEALAAGCATVNIDLEYYGVKMPTMPVSGVHYLALDFDRIDHFVDRLVDEPNSLECIAAKGRRWAEDYYSPVAAAKRFLAMFGWVESESRTGAEPTSRNA